MSNCSLCGSASVSTHQENETIKYKSGFVTALLPYSVCDECDYEFVSTEQIKASDALIREAKKAYDGLYTSEEIKAARGIT
ncbi:MAG: hypothetical protein IBX55_22005 [Methyloprofundus sp.]|nr:hypothetical protein [Methyloprofundus sp.]